LVPGSILSVRQKAPVKAIVFSGPDEREPPIGAGIKVSIAGLVQQVKRMSFSLKLSLVLTILGY
jgi:hypothetical protein